LARTPCWLFPLVELCSLRWGHFRRGHTCSGSNPRSSNWFRCHLLTERGVLLSIFILLLLVGLFAFYYLFCCHKIIGTGCWVAWKLSCC
jgi:hypothetical protein